MKEKDTIASFEAKLAQLTALGRANKYTLDTRNFSSESSPSCY